jgi:thiol-disulfide isomerase/thioredoxin
MVIQNNLAIVLGVLVLILLIKVFLESNYYKSIINNIQIEKINTNRENNIYQKQLQDIINLTQRKINNASEKGILEAFQSIQSENNKRGYLTSYLNRTNIIKIQLFYKPSCTYCKKFLPTWNRIINNLPADATYEEINCENDFKLAQENNITTVPTIILLVDNQKYTYMGNRTYTDIDYFLRKNGVNLIERQFEKFNEKFNNGYSTLPEPTTPLNPHCPSVTFDKQIDLENDSYMYQIFNTDGQYGYSVGGNNDKLLTPYMAAYSTVDSYLSSLPDDQNPNQSSYKNINECALLYADNIINFGLCDIDQLNNILGYQSNIDAGIETSRIADTNYSTNTNVVNAIKNACGFST